MKALFYWARIAFFHLVFYIIEYDEQMRLTNCSVMAMASHERLIFKMSRVCGAIWKTNKV